MMLNAVVFPAPFGPMRLTTLPSGTWNVRSLIATNLRNLLATLCTSSAIAGAVGGPARTHLHERGAHGVVFLRSVPVLPARARGRLRTARVTAGTMP